MTVVTEYRDHNLHCNHRETAFDTSKNTKSYTTETRREKTRVQLFIVHHNPPESFEKLQTKKNREMSRANKNPAPSSNAERPRCRNNGNYKHRLNARISSSLQIPSASKIPRILVLRRIQQQEQATSAIQKQEEKKIQINKKVFEQEDEEGEYSTRLLDKEVRMCRKTRSWRAPCELRLSFSLSLSCAVSLVLGSDFSKKLGYDR